MDHYWEERAKRSVERYEQAVRQAIPEMLKAFYSANRVVVGVNYPPFHVNCRTVAVPHYPTTDTARMTRAARDAEGNPITVPADMKYEEWYQTYIEKSPKSGIIKAEKAQQTLTDDEEWALNEYISSGSYKINAPLREGIELTQEQQELVRNLDSALEKMPTYRGKIVRTLNIPEEDVPAFLKQHEEQKEIQYFAYTSFSDKKGYGFNENVTIFIENSEKGKDCREWNPNESEIIYSRNSKFKVIKTVKRSGKVFILMEER